MGGMSDSSTIPGDMPPFSLLTYYVTYQNKQQTHGSLSSTRHVDTFLFLSWLSSVNFLPPRYLGVCLGVCHFHVLRSPVLVGLTQ